jgi:hypothetical protein
MAWCPNCGAEGGKGKSHNQFTHLGGGYCGRFSLPFDKAKERLGVGLTVRTGRLGIGGGGRMARSGAVDRALTDP